MTGKKWSKGSRIFLSIALMILICSIDLRICVKKIRDTLPYPRHMDESFITQRALSILKTNDWNPHEFNYSSFPVYLTTGALSLGYLRYAGKGELRGIDKIQSVTYPYYDPPEILLPARVLFALFMVVAFMAMGLAAWRLFMVPELIFAVPCVASLSQILLYHGWRYVNVDTLATAMAALTLMVVAFHGGSPSFWLTAILPGILCGLTAAGKYTYVGILFPAILAIWLFGKRWRFYRTLVLVLASVGAFICVVPYSLLDINAFVEELGKLAASYARGRVGRIYEPGWDHARQYILFALKDIGPYSLFLAILGMVYGFLKNWRGALIMGLFPLLLVALLSATPTFYERNAMFSYLYYGLLVAVGLFAAGQFIFRVTGKIARIGSRNILRTGIAVAAVCLLAWSILPLGRQRTMFAVSPDTRNQAVEWIRQNVPKGAAILMPPELCFYVKPLAGEYQMLVHDYASFRPETFTKEAARLGAAYAMMPVWTSPDNKTKASADMKNKLREGISPLIEYRGNPIGGNATYPVFWGDPAFMIGKLN